MQHSILREETSMLLDCFNTPPQGEKSMHSLLHNKDSCQCEAPFSHLETLIQIGHIPEKKSGKGRKWVK